MSTITIAKTYADNAILFEAEMDASFASISDFLSNTQLMSDNINSNTFTTSKFINSSITTAELASNAFTAAKLDSSTVTDSDRAVGTDHIKDAVITTAKLASNIVTRAKLPVVNSFLSSSTGIFGNSTTGEVAVTNLTGTLTVGGGTNVFIAVLADPDPNSLFRSSIVTTGTPGTIEMRLYRDSTIIAKWAKSEFQASNFNQPFFLDQNVPAGSPVYTLKVINSTGGANNFFIQYMKLYGVEL